MSAMGQSTRAFQAALLIGWIALGAAGLLYAHARGIPGLAAGSAIVAILIAYPFYLVAGFPDIRKLLAGPYRFPLCALGLSVLPYLACCCGAVPFQWNGLMRVAAVGVALGLWYQVLPKRLAVDLAFLALTGAILLGKYFEPVYPPFQKEKLVIVGHISLYVIAILALMVERCVPETGFGFVPTAREWRVGAIHYLYFVAGAIPLVYLFHATHLVPIRPLWTIASSILAWLWFVALTEEFFFRGVLQPELEQRTGSRTAGLILASVAFGLIHYWFRGWPWVPVTMLLGFCTGRARNLTGGIRAGVVTHTLVVATWKAFFA
jgi:membrane protease YdiL (CAAX protease family)